MAKFSPVDAAKGGIVSVVVGKVFGYGLKRLQASQAILETLQLHVLDHEGKPTIVGEPVEVDHLVITITKIESPPGHESITPRYHVLVICPDLP